MELITRRDAITAGLNKYFTGIPCKNQHLTFRYTTSGACSGCIRSYSGSLEELQQRSERRQKLQTMIQFRMRVFLQDLDFFRSIVLATARARESSVELLDVWKRAPGLNRFDDTAIHLFNCFAEDLRSLRQTGLKIYETTRTAEPLPNLMVRLTAKLDQEIDDAYERESPKEIL